jgi:hypothetical protein
MTEAVRGRSNGIGGTAGARSRNALRRVLAANGGEIAVQIVGPPPGRPPGRATR